MSIPTPQIGHFTGDDYEHVYEPAEDSFILLDALEQDATLLREMRPSLCVEIGSGSGIVSTFLATLLGDSTTCIISTDINIRACEATLKTAAANTITLDPVLCNLVDPIRARMSGRVDILLFNPPYVPTETSELAITQGERGIGGAWAGGLAGMELTDTILAQIPRLLSPHGHLYLVAVEPNKPTSIVNSLGARGISAEIVLRRRAGRELLSVIRITNT